MIKEKKYKILINEIVSILNSEPELSFNAKLILISAILYNKNSEWLFCGFYMVKEIDLLEIRLAQLTQRFSLTPVWAIAASKIRQIEVP